MSTVSSRTVVDDAARTLIRTDGLDRTLFVEAGAGSGKTTQLVNRIVSLVLHRGVRLADIAAITFTEAAAAELQSRVRVGFETIASTTDDPAVAARCIAALADADLAAITTLHGFASRLLNEFAIEAQLPPRLRVLDEVSSQLAHEQRWSRFVDRLYDDPANADLLLRARGLGVPLEQRYPGHATFRDVADVLNQNWDRIEPIAALEPPVIGPIDFAEFDAAAAAVRALPALCGDPDDRFLDHLRTKVIPSLDEIAAVDDPLRRLATMSATSRTTAWGRGRGGRDVVWGGDVGAQKDVVSALKAAADQVIRREVDPVLRHLLVLTAREVLGAARARRDDGGLEFHDLLVLAREVLRRSDAARSVLHDRYRHVLLDEFQDTDPIQIELATLIAATPAAGEPGAWHELPVEPGRLFFVGDPKQSIYRFRRADIELFLAARDRFGADGARVDLVTNFRTVEPVLDWVNAFFAEAMPVEVPAAQPAYTRLAAHRPPSATGDHRPVLLGGPHHDTRVRAGELREAEAADVSRTIEAIRDRPADWPVFDAELDDWRPARLSDVTILLPTRTSLPYLRRALGAAAIPYRLATGTLVYDTQEVRDALAALRAVDDPTDQLSLVAALRSPLYACSDADLFTFRQAGGQWNLRAPLPPRLPHDHPVVGALTHQAELWRDRWWQRPADLLERLLRERRAELLAFGDPRPEEVWRRLRFLLDQARAFEEARGGGLRAFLEWTALQGADGARVHEPMLAETDTDAVDILTVHGSKGLEFGITILSGMTTRPTGTRPGVSVIWGESELPELRLSTNVATADHEPRADLEQAMDEHEKLRLLYVAATRARDHLVVSCHHQPGAAGLETYAGRMWAAFAERDHLWRRLDVVQQQLDLGLSPEPVLPPAAAVPPSGPAPADDRDRWIRDRDALLAGQRAARVTSATAIARDAADHRVDPDGHDVLDDHDDLDGHDDPDLDDLDDDHPVGPSLPPRRRGRAGSAIGRAVHATLEVLDLTDPRDVEAQVARQCEIEAIPDLADTVESFVRSALASDAVALAADLPHHQELFVSGPVGERAIEGYVDLLVEGPDGLIVVDYKTDSAASERQIDAALDRYELQGAAYAVVLEAVTGRPVVDCRFVFCRAGGAIERSVRDLPAAMATVRAHLGG